MAITVSDSAVAELKQVMEAQSGWENQAGSGNFLPRPPDRPLTKFERRGQRLGHRVWDLGFRWGPPETA